jgi:C4-dicarboxylate transporter DctM subunit
MLLPAAKLLGVDLVHFGVLVVLNMMIGLIHPPFGMLLFVTKALTGIPIGEMMKEGWPFLVMVMLLLLLIAITVFPQIVLWLPQTMGYKTLQIPASVRRPLGSTRFTTRPEPLMRLRSRR